MKIQIVQIVADRFGVARDGRAIDLATGARVALEIGVGGGASEQMRWALRCGRLQELHHPRLPALVDYGALGEVQRFEAWRVASLRSSQGGRQGQAARTLSTLEASGLETESLENCAICTIDRRADAVVANLLASLEGPRPHIISIWGPCGSGRTIAALRAARVARLNGFVPIGVPILDQIDGELLKDRHLFIISDDERGTPWSAPACLLSVALASPRIHVLLRIGRDELAGVHGVGLDRIPANALVAAVRPFGLNRRLLDQVKRAAAMSRGLPARFAELLWRGRVDRRGSAHQNGARRPSRVAEQPVV